MLIFNCTEAAGKFFSRVHKGKTITPVDNKPPSSVIEDDELNSFDERWLVHAITTRVSRLRLLDARKQSGRFVRLSKGCV